MATPSLNDDTVANMIQQRDFHLEQARRIDDALAVLRDVGKVAMKATRLTDAVRAQVTGVPVVKQPSARVFALEHAEKQYASPSAEARRLVALAAAQGLHYHHTAMLSGMKAARTGHYADGKPIGKQSAGRPAGTGVGSDFVRQHANWRAANGAVEIQRLVALGRQHGLALNEPGVRSAFYEMRSKLRKSGTLPKLGPGHRPLAAPARRSAKEISREKFARDRRKSGDSVRDRIRAVFVKSGDAPVTREQLAEQAKVAEAVYNPKFAQQATARVLAVMKRAKEVRETKDGWIAHKLLQPTMANDNGAQANA